MYLTHTIAVNHAALDVVSTGYGCVHTCRSATQIQRIHARLVGMLVYTLTPVSCLGTSQAVNALLIATASPLPICGGL